MPTQSRLSFPDGFLWGTATASYQVEGAASEDGRGASIWDSFSKTPGRVAHGHTGDVACDQYHRYREDVALMRALGVDAYRFSIAWPRVLPDGSGAVNRRGIDYYKRLATELLEAGIKPVATLYHWDLPQALQDAGGWPARDTAFRFAEYAEVCYEQLGDLVDMWITLNEPFCASVVSYLYGSHAPGERDRPRAYRAIHHLNLAHGLALEAYREAGLTRPIGIALNLETPRPATQRAEDREAADRAADLQTRMFLDPLLGRGYPQRHLDAYPQAPMPVEEGDLAVIAGKIDFLGINYYFEHAVAHDANHPEGFREVVQHYPTTQMGWYVVPQGLYRQLRWVHDYTGGLTIYITENGCAYPDALTEDGASCHDRDRIDYLREHLAASARAVEDGVNLAGYFLWSFIDNFEWSYGYTRRFGIVYCDYVNNRRIPKDSFYFYRDVIAGHQ